MLVKKDVQIAYKKLKSQIYYDNSDLFLRAKLAAFEAENLETNVLSSKLDRLFVELVHYDINDESSYWKNLFDEINFKILPKKIKEVNKDNSNSKIIKNFFSNQRDVKDGDNFKIEKLTIFIECPIEFQIIAVLWIMKFGYM